MRVRYSGPNISARISGADVHTLKAYSAGLSPWMSPMLRIVWRGMHENTQIETATSGESFSGPASGAA
jgi:hypothetical protein